jgi:NADPH-dependent F420 reductase
LDIMKVAIIGTGNVGSALAGSFSRAGHDVTLAARDGAKTRTVTRSLGATAAASTTSAVAGADVVVLAVPYGAVREVAAEIRPLVAGKVVIDVTNPLKSDYSGLATGDGPSGAEQLASQLVDAKVVKAFNTVFSGLQGDPDSLGTTLDALYATDDADAREAVYELAESVGFRPVYVGPLSAARELEAMAWLNIRLQMLTNGTWNSAFVLVAPPAAATEA